MFTNISKIRYRYNISLHPATLLRLAAVELGRYVNIGSIRVYSRSFAVNLSPQGLIKAQFFSGSDHSIHTNQ